MPNKRVAHAVESFEDLLVIHPNTITACLKSEVRADQDERLDTQVIKPVWGTKAFTALRENDFWHPLHQHLDQAKNDEAITMQRRRAGIDHIHVPSMMGDYEQLVIALACANDKPFIPVDVWPDKPKPVEMPPEAHRVFQAVIDILRREIHLFTPGKLRLNKHYALLLAHLLLSPDEIHHAHDISVCYPWPFILRLDDEGSAHLERQRDITTDQQLAANMVERALFASEKQAPPMPRHPSRKAKAKRNEQQRELLQLGAIAYHLNSGQIPIPYSRILGWHEFTEPQKTMKTKITSRAGVSRAIHAYCKANDKPLPKAVKTTR